MLNEENAKVGGRIIAKAWTDEGFKARLLADPAAVLKAEGVEVPAGVTLNVVENSGTAYTLVLPARPTDLSDEDLDSTAAGAILCVIPCGSTF
ncbi:NHLP leader peptide family RiPP precursor [Nitrospirillum amazonense]|uniref:Putative ribosomally synthesized peptide n=1 Tax=Nitrospirillum amazonense TaxID=28077 RepID=A0A560JJC7_9PROT|nr:NHLP leader peptide family RiPP precursor [Nitrospirillum amazonense]MDG3439615.1 NHLP leader peptide family RiPP precursor [Nitrospirillum amazonense]TWB70659.1 putative ribosomally synthesized peptide [Nitrospirillum amazonense]